MQQPHARADPAVPADERRAILDEATLLGGRIDPVPHERQVLVALEQAKDGLAGDGTNIEPREAHLDLARGEGKRIRRESQEAQHFLFHLGAVGQDVAHQDPVRADLARQLVHGLEVGDVLAHDDEGDPDFDLMMPAASVHSLEIPQVLDHAIELRPLAEAVERRPLRAVKGDPELVEPVFEEPSQERPLEGGPVRGQFHPDPESLDLSDHAQDIRMRRRFPESSEHHRFEAFERLELADEAVEGRPFHVAQGLGPGVADAGRADQVAAGRRFDIDPRQGVETRPDLDETSVFDDLEAVVSGCAQLSEKPGRKNQSAVLSDANTMHAGFFLDRRSVVPDFFEFSHVIPSPICLSHPSASPPTVLGPYPLLEVPPLKIECHIDQADHDWHLDKRPDDRGESLSGVDAEDGHGHGNG